MKEIARLEAEKGFIADLHDLRNKLGAAEMKRRRKLQKVTCV